MKFDKNKVLTCVRADQARVGQKGWFGETLSSLEKRVEKEPPEVLERVWLSGDRRYIFMTSNDSWSLFYPAPEPTYRPYSNDELNDLVGEVLTNKRSGRRKLVTGKPTASEGVNLDGSYITAKDLLASFYRNGNEPCGVREET